MTDEELVAVANFQTRTEAETAAGLLLGADIPYVIQSREGAQLGPGPGGTTILVRPVATGTSLPNVPSKETTGSERPFQLTVPSIQLWAPASCCGAVYRTTSATQARGTIRRSPASGTSRL